MPERKKPWFVPQITEIAISMTQEKPGEPPGEHNGKLSPGGVDIFNAGHS